MPMVPLVAFSAQSGRDVIARAVAAGASSFVAKPVDLQRVLTLVDTFIGRQDDRVTAPRETRQALEAIVASAPVAITTTDREHRISMWNLAAGRCSAGAQRSAENTSAAHPPELEEETKALRVRALAGETIAPYETQRIRKDGTRIDVSLALTPIRTPAARSSARSGSGRHQLPGCSQASSAKDRQPSGRGRQPAEHTAPAAGRCPGRGASAARR